MCVGNKDVRLRQDRTDRALLYNTIKGWADPKMFKMSMQRFWPIEGDELSDIIMPTRDKIVAYDQRFRSIGSKKKWLE